MRRSALSNALAAMSLLPLAGCAQPWLTQEGDLWVRTFHETAVAKPRLRIVSHGPVILEGNSAPGFEFTLKVSVRARSREQARMLLERAVPQKEFHNDWLVLTTP